MSTVPLSSSQLKFSRAYKSKESHLSTNILILAVKAREVLPAITASPSAGGYPQRPRATFHEEELDAQKLGIALIHIHFLHGKCATIYLSQNNTTEHSTFSSQQSSNLGPDLHTYSSFARGPLLVPLVSNEQLQEDPPHR